MSKNKFEGFFEDENHPAINEFAPPPSKYVEMLMMICGQNNQFYMDPKLRLIVAGVMQHLTNGIVEAQDRGEKIDLHVGYAAFMMLLADRMEDSYEEYASEDEREQFPIN
jgi:hypothetical protein